ncbi:hypothetical protein QBC39DRAFT_34940 [Podospora conica]|nr:hypothetical protein QBC39DRAFT_34940 [Schizothecium conicum]
MLVGVSWAITVFAFSFGLVVLTGTHKSHRNCDDAIKAHGEYPPSPCRPCSPTHPPPKAYLTLPPVIRDPVPCQQDDGGAKPRLIGCRRLTPAHIEGAETPSSPPPAGFIRTHVVGDTATPRDVRSGINDIHPYAMCFRSGPILLPDPHREPHSRYETDCLLGHTYPNEGYSRCGTPTHGERAVR